MKILLTGASSFTGYWFATELARAEHEVHATFRGGPEDYVGIRSKRVANLMRICRPVWRCGFGDEAFLDHLSSGVRWDILCHHGADVTDYKSPDFDVVNAVANNTFGIHPVLSLLKEKGCQRVLVTGSVFEGGEGAGSDGLPAFSAYGLSKEISWRVFQYYTQQFRMHLGKFVIPNPFGPFEEPRFTAYLIKTWKSGEEACVQTPEYVRDNIHVSLLARVYRHFVENLPDTPGWSRTNPSGYIESQGQFAHRFADEMRERLKMPCELRLVAQNVFVEPRIRINTETARIIAPEWSESAAWDELAAYYKNA